MTDLVFKRRISEYNDTIRLQLPKEIPKGLGMKFRKDNDNSRSKYSSVHVISMPRLGGFFVRDVMSKPVNELQPLIASLKDNISTDLGIEQVEAWERTVDTMRTLKEMPIEVSEDKEFIKHYKQREKQMKKLSELRAKCHQLELGINDCEQNMVSIVFPYWHPKYTKSKHNLSGRTHQGKKAFIE